MYQKTNETRVADDEFNDEWYQNAGKMVASNGSRLRLMGTWDSTSVRMMLPPAKIRRRRRWKLPHQRRRRVPCRITRVVATDCDRRCGTPSIGPAARSSTPRRRRSSPAGLVGTSADRTAAPLLCGMQLNDIVSPSSSSSTNVFVAATNDRVSYASIKFLTFWVNVAYTSPEERSLGLFSDGEHTARTKFHKY